MPNETQVQPSSSVPEVTASAQASTGATVMPSAVEASAYTCTAMPSVNNSTGFNPGQNPGAFPTFENCQLVTAIGQPTYNFGVDSNLNDFTAYMKVWYSNFPEEIQTEYSE